MFVEIKVFLNGSFHMFVTDDMTFFIGANLLQYS